MITQPEQGRVSQNSYQSVLLPVINSALVGGRTSQRRDRGFTLIELLVVVVIVGVLAGTVLLNATNRGTQYRLDADADRLLQVMQLARAQALQRNREWGVVIGDDGYGFAELSDADGWLNVGDKTFDRKQLTDVELRLEVEGRQAKLIETVAERAGKGAADDPDRDEGAAALTPSLVLFSSGELTPFELELFPGDALQTNWLISDGLNLRIARTNDPVEQPSVFDR